MDGARAPSPPRPRSKRRRSAFLLFAIFGLPAVFSVLFLPFAPAALPWLIVSWSIVGVSGYQIWRIDHPGESARSAMGVRVRWLAPAAAFVVVVLVLGQVDPAWFIAGVVVWVLVSVAFGLILSSLAKTERDLVARSPSPAQIG